MTSLWSPEQQAWLKALGHRVFVLAGDEPGPDALASGHAGDARPASLPDGEAAPPVALGRGADAGAHTAERVRPRPPVAPVESGAGMRRSIPAGIAPAAPPRTPPSRVPEDALERALLRVTGQRTRSEARAVLERLEVDVQALRANPAAKRALWLKLRPLQPRFRP